MKESEQIIYNMKTPTSLPYGLQIAAGATELDNIKIVPVNDWIKLYRTLSVLPFFNHEERLIKKCIKKLNNDIKKQVKINRKSTIYVYCLCKIVERGFFVCAEMSYEIR
ncbi:hypothetical protein M0Q50_00980 [bacterium]|jgi:hypothetical protein|nr:hypothetical protein [bacterium]